MVSCPRLARRLSGEIAVTYPPLSHRRPPAGNPAPGADGAHARRGGLRVVQARPFLRASPQGGMVTQNCMPACAAGTRCIGGACQACGGRGPALLRGPDGRRCGRLPVAQLPLRRSAGMGRPGSARTAAAAVSPAVSAGSATACVAPLRCIDAPGDALETCGMCGGRGQPCCTTTGGAPACEASNSCVGAGMGMAGSCRACGGMGEPCCSTMGGAIACHGAARLRERGDGCGGRVRDLWRTEPAMLYRGGRLPVGQHLHEQHLSALRDHGARLLSDSRRPGALPGAARLRQHRRSRHLRAGLWWTGTALLRTQQHLLAGKQLRQPGDGGGSNMQGVWRRGSALLCHEHLYRSEQVHRPSHGDAQHSAAPAVDRSRRAARAILPVTRTWSARPWVRVSSRSAPPAAAPMRPAVPAPSASRASAATIRGPALASASTPAGRPERLAARATTASPALRCLGGAVGGADAGVAAMTCQACGAANQRCCSQGVECRGGTTCVGGVMNGTCMPCGAVNQACCTDESAT